MKKRALVIDDDPLSLEFLVEALERARYKVRQARTGEEGLARLQGEKLDLVITDLRLPGMDGIHVVREVRDRLPGVPVAVLTAFGTVSTAVEAMRAGAEDFLVKPVSPEQLEVVLARCESNRKLRRENKVLKASLLATPPAQTRIIGRHPSLLKILALARRVAPTEATALIRGESGTGKELLAALIHESSPRHRGPFIKVNCAALTESLLTSELFGHEKGAFTGAHSLKEGRFELAAGGTLFLDEIGDLPWNVQAKLLRVLETGDFERVGGTRTLLADVRVLTATNRNLELAIQEGRFREDLFYRLNVVPLVLPPLRERVQDVPLLADHFLRRFRREHGRPELRLSASASRALCTAQWPGNVRELANCIQRGVLVAEGSLVEVSHLGLPEKRTGTAAAVPVGLSLEEVERRVILKTLDATNWNRTEAARILEVTPRTLRNKLKLWRSKGLFAASQEGAVS